VLVEVTAAFSVVLFHKATFTIAKGSSYDQRVGLLIHNGDARTGNVAKRYQAYCDGEF
jgi:hypothetical protein